MDKHSSMKAAQMDGIWILLKKEPLEECSTQSQKNIFASTIWGEKYFCQNKRTPVIFIWVDYLIT